MPGAGAAQGDVAADVALLHVGAKVPHLLSPLMDVLGSPLLDLLAYITLPGEDDHLRRQASLSTRPMMLVGVARPTCFVEKACLGYFPRGVLPEAVEDIPEASGRGRWILGLNFEL